MGTVRSPISRRSDTRSNVSRGRVSKRRAGADYVRTVSVAALSNTLGRQTMLPLMDRKYIRVVALASLFGIVGVFILT